MVVRYRDFSFAFWTLIFSVFLMRMGQFMILPFLSIILTVEFHTSPLMIGIIIGAGWATYACASFNCGYWVDRYGAKKIILISLLIGALAFIGILFKQSILSYLLLSIILGFCRSAFNAASRAYIYLITKPEQQLLAFGANYIAINAGFGIGLLVGTLFAINNSITLFLWLASSYFILVVLLHYYLPKPHIVVKINHKIRITLANTIGAVLNDKKLLWLVLAGFCLWLTYVQTDSTLPIYLVQHFTNGAIAYAEIIAINALLATFLQPVISNLMKHATNKTQVWYGLLLFIAGYLCYVFWNNTPMFMIGMGLLTLGELVIFPATDVWIGYMATPERAGAYYAAGNFTMLGNGIGPIIGGFFYPEIGIHWLFMSCAIISLVIIPLYIMSVPKIRSSRG